MPSEQAAGRPVYSSDLYSFGLTAIYALTGKKPQQLNTDSTTGEILWHQYASNISQDLIAVLDKAIRWHPRERYYHAKDMLDALQSVAVPIPNTTPTPISVNPPHTQKNPGIQERESTTSLSETLIQPIDDLSSQKGIDYTRLRDLLATEKWKDADYETSLVMLKIVGREKGDWIRDEELLNFPCTDLRTIDQLWVKYSNGRFGFSVQQKIYLEVGGVPDGKFYQEAWEKFGDRVGWKVEGSWIYYLNCTFDIKALVGHLPVREHLPVVPRWRGGREGGQEYSSLASRLINCNI